jgi:hypothetical protein
MSSRAGAISVWLVLAWVASASAQSTGNAAWGSMRPAAAIDQTALLSGGHLLREIVDPSTGDLWLLLRDPSHPAGPGRLVLARQGAGPLGKTGAGTVQPLPGSEPPIVHAGDALLVEEHTPVVDTRLEAVALGPAIKGRYFKARLKIGGKVVYVEAVAPGYAVFGPKSEVKP